SSETEKSRRRRSKYCTAGFRSLNRATNSIQLPICHWLQMSRTNTNSGDHQELVFLSATKLARLIRAKEISAVEAVTAYYARIDAVNPKINAVVQFCRDRAYAEARTADRALAHGEV